MTTILRTGRERLIDLNVSILAQASAIASALADRIYVQPAPGTNGVRIGAHLRHVIEFYECFLLGTERGLIDYGARKRNPVIETDRMAAIQRLSGIVHELNEAACKLAFDSACSVLPEDGGPDEQPLASTVGRELQVLLSHATHHFALIAVALHAFGIPVDPAFGVAPSTLRYRASREKAA
jgi:hypothetical protein